MSMGHTHVFVHVGDRVRVQAPNGKYLAPLITGVDTSSYNTSQLNLALKARSEEAISYIVCWERPQIISYYLPSHSLVQRQTDRHL